jgi:hypothetical protein
MQAQADAVKATRVAGRVPDEVAPRGQRVRFGPAPGKEVQLPADACLGGPTITMTEQGERAFETVHRGTAKAFVDQRTGTVTTVVEDPARPGLMTFLGEALKCGRSQGAPGPPRGGRRPGPPAQGCPANHPPGLRFFALGVASRPPRRAPPGA